jgi:hypothetical protein
MTREATLSECYHALRYNGVDVIGATFFAFVLYMRKTKIIYEKNVS